MKSVILCNSILAAILTGWMGCTIPSVEPTVPTVTTTTIPESTNLVLRVGVIGGVHIGNFGACDGADVDAITQHHWIDDGRPTRLLQGWDTTVPAAQKAMLDMAKRLDPSDWSKDLMTLGFSGHGTLRKRLVNVDTLGEMEGGLCFADRVWWGSEIAAWIRDNIPPIRIEYFADCCHAENNWRAIGNAVTFGYVRKSLPVVVKIDPPIGWKGQMCEWAGCRQNAYSFGMAGVGGTWTQTLDKNLKPDIQRLQFYTQTADKMPDEQRPAWCEWNVSDEFRNGAVFQ